MIMKRKPGIEEIFDFIRFATADMRPSPACELFHIECSGTIKGKSDIKLDDVPTWLVCATWPDGTSSSIRLDATDIFSKPLLTYFMGRRFRLPFRNPISRKVRSRKGLCQETASADFKKFKACDLKQFSRNNVRARGLSLRIEFISENDRFSIRENMFLVEAVNAPDTNQSITSREFEPLLKAGFTSQPTFSRVQTRPRKRPGGAAPAIIFSEQATSLLLENYFIPNLMRSNIMNGVSCFKNLKEAVSCANKSDILVRLSDNFINNLGVNDTASKAGNLVVTSEWVSGLVDTFDTGIDKEIEPLFRNLKPKIEVFSESAVSLPELKSAAGYYCLERVPGLTTNYDWRGGYEIDIAAGLTSKNAIKVKDKALNIFTSGRYGVWKDPATLRHGLYYKNDGS